MDAAEIKALIENGIDGAHVQIFTDDNTHYAALVVGEYLHVSTVDAILDQGLDFCCIHI